VSSFLFSDGWSRAVVRNVGPETKALGFSMQSISLLYGPVWQDDELVFDNQGFWFRRNAKVCLNTERLSGIVRRKAKAAGNGRARWKCRIAVIPPHERVSERFPSFNLDVPAEGDRN